MWVKVLKWVGLGLVVPAGVAALGFFVIGPNMGQVPILDQGAAKAASLVGQAGQEPAAEPQQPPAEPEPSKSKISADSTVIRRSRNQHRRAEITVVKEGRPKPENQEPPLDEASPQDDTLPGEESSGASQDGQPASSPDDSAGAEPDTLTGQTP